MRPSMMTLVSRILNELLAGLLAAEDAAQGRQVEHVALAGAHHQAHVGHPEQQPDLNEGDRRRVARQSPAEITSDIRKAPRIPSTEPAAAPMSRFRLTSLTRISNPMMASARSSPASAE